MRAKNFTSVSSFFFFFTLAMAFFFIAALCLQETVFLLKSWDLVLSSTCRRVLGSLALCQIPRESLMDGVMRVLNEYLSA